MSMRLGTRAVERLVPAGTMLNCKHCDKAIKFAARVRNKQVIANVYKRSKWDRIEHFHPECYLDAGNPHGEVDISQSDALIKQRRPG
jgi:hypothetical protein